MKKIVVEVKDDFQTEEFEQNGEIQVSFWGVIKFYEMPEKKPRNKVPPEFSDVVAYCNERNRGVDPHKWFDHYVSNGWKVGKNPMKDWQAAVRTWEHSDYGFNEPRVDRVTDKPKNFFQTEEGKKLAKSLQP